MERPNVLFVVLDTTRADHTSVHGYERPTTPELERLAVDGVRFDKAFSAAPWTPPSHGSMFSGVHPTSHGFLSPGMSYTPPHSTLAERLRAEGYRTFGAATTSFIATRSEVTRGFDDFCDLYRLPFVPTTLHEARSYYLDLLPGYLRMARGMLSTERKPTEYLSCEYMRTRIRRSAGQQPFFGFINILSAHNRYAPPEPYRSRFKRGGRTGVDEELVDTLSDSGGYRYMAGELEPNEGEWAALQDLYDGEIALADSVCGMLFDTLRNVGVYDDTMVIVTADHGEHFGEHRRAHHQFSLFDELLHVPLIIKPPGGADLDDVRDDLVSLVDIYPTILSELNLSVPETVEGSDLFGPRSTDVVFAEYGEPKTGIDKLRREVEGPIDDSVLEELDHALQCARTRNEKYLRVHGGEDRIYDVGTGTPKDTLRRTGRHDELAARMSEVLGTDLQVEKSDPSDRKVRENLEALGYR